MYVSKNPFTGIVDKEFPIITNGELIQALEQSHQSFLNWQKSSFTVRVKLLLKMADLLEERKEFYGRIISNEMGKPITQSEGEVEKCAWVCRYYSEKGIELLNSRDVESSASLSRVVFEPLGTVLAVMPWNFPFWQVFRFAAPAVMTGNAVLLKHASNVPQCALAIEQLFKDSGAPEGVFQNLFIDYAQVEQVIASALVKGVTFTGSNQAGSYIASLAGKYIKKSVLELGGSDPFIIFDDADLFQALQEALLSRFLNAGQSCIAAKRFIVHENISVEFLTNFQSLVENLTKGNPLDHGTFIGPLVSEKALHELEDLVQTSISMGAKCAIGGEVCEYMRTVYEPTILYDVPMESPVWTEEVFGPVASVRFFETDEEAITLANDTRFGLGASVWTKDPEKAEWACRQLQAGMVVVNGMLKSEPGLPFGGINESGYGRELGNFGLYEFVNIKTVSYF
ncbi:MAG TPA: NADP-dependent succinic semialdehyde dehydrogenase [Marinilabiliales bacterium]|jgi:succinate-semialdehyde dehydrogenase/glutarate-semialdehyde dehydrogenase|nr:MAG: hypothetical protein A2W95_14040 [Bacteroidetes bacterium GWA2_40_14]OFX56640.1 MAG: hypothetical protein A2W84_07590 [Bacteroidetes bacterium GWC2_40_13]OFX71794.1 MAG: hypothetical protein A2W96_06065 [Bacteroidetes bacterium GWD2_40_43]OFX94591.1 MAG: hypothetical protein A2W97_17870 [Bacteroidetes bacterium GWE2_40_63]OFY22444.1 MAG: hypothetical protein A2W88_07870 [Bacteroidetes bacterium GWF2_40_13]OFZ24359.1 MAG: hypothetical protein A2437_18000 [Bacteroidetes bacterium RIFOXYC